MKEVRPGQATPYFTSADLLEVDRICAKCPHFLKKETGTH
jgi:hypothetical protein